MKDKILNSNFGLESLNSFKETILTEGKNPSSSKNIIKKESTVKDSRTASKTPIQTSNKNRPAMK